MSIFNEEQIKAMISREYICHECGHLMEFEDEWEDTKSTYWAEVDSWLTDSLYLHPKFKEYFDSRSGECTDGLYPTVTIRQIMWALKMKPIQRQRWETCFDRRDI